MSDDDEDRGVLARARRAAEWVQGLRPVRVALHYGAVQGPILASGLAFSGMFSVFAALWVGFAVAGLVITGDLGLRSGLIEFINENVPGLIATGGNDGAVDPDMLLSAGVFGWTGAIALVTLLVTAVNWLAGARSAVRAIFDLPQDDTNFLLLRLKDLGLAAGFGLLLIVSAGLSVFGTAAAGWLLDAIGVGADSTVGNVLGRGVTLLVMFLLDAVVLGSLYRVLAGVDIPWPRLRVGVLLGAAALGALKVGASYLLGDGSRNPLLASFAVIVGLLIFFNLVCQVILASAAWIAVGIKDRGIVISPEVQRERLEKARRLVEEYDEQELKQGQRPQGMSELYRHKRG